MRHSIRLQDEFNILEKENDDFYNWKQSWADKREKFFIKNIERVQGDERDAIIITPGYAPNLDGNVPLQFGSLNRQGGERRLNVAASRSKEYMHLITSMRSSDIELKRTKSPSIALLRSYLEFMENEGRLFEAEYEFSVPTKTFE
jgi:superfamily I DNA and/or RNA helicase